MRNAWATSYTRAVVTARRPSLFLAVDDPNLLDLLTRVFEGRGFVIGTGATARRVISHLEGERVFDVVVAAWDTTRTIGGEVYKWVLRHRTDLRARFVFISDDAPAELDRVVAGRCLALRSEELEELVRVVETLARRTERASALPQADAQWLGSDRPALLAVDDDLELLQIMVEVLGDVGFQVTACDSGNAAIAQLEHAEFDVVLSDWYMPDGSGAELYRWLCTNQPWMLERLVFLTGADRGEAEQIAAGVPVVPKGQDSATLIQLLTHTARKTRAA